MRYTARVHGRVSKQCSSEVWREGARRRLARGSKRVGRLGAARPDDVMGPK
jgi:hypothetical protein